jgi:sugar phosphate isomerase/epimerase
LILPPALSSTSSPDPYAPLPDLTNKNPPEVIYLGNSMLERLKTTGKHTPLAQLPTSWNAGCGGDKNENVVLRLQLGMYDLLKHNAARTIKLWVLASGTNNLHPKRKFRESDVQSWRVLLEACLRIAPESVVLACDMFYRKDVPDGVVDESNGLLEEVVRSVNVELGAERVKWVQLRREMGKEMLVDHVHLDEEGYSRWNELLWPLVQEVLHQGEDA